ncbi:helix-turn-helix domain-containing protein [Streptomyces sp. NPDC048636]|uniref:TetR/AcrR family transcriptional regulator n=1 Tax=Streptomyces sp. NPDC048636 TaxID=3155762 RepID=UPI0034423357
MNVETDTPDRRERRRQGTRSRIIDAALELFAECGYAATSVDAIAERADVARRTLFNHFPRKQDLVVVWAGERRKQLSLLVSEDSAHARTGASMLRRQFDLLAEENERDLTLASVLVQGWLVEISDLAEVFPVFTSFRDAVAVGQGSGEFTDGISADAVCEVLTAVYTDTLGRWVQPQAEGDGPPFSLRAAMRAKLELILAGMSTQGHAGS